MKKPVLQQKEKFQNRKTWITPKIYLFDNQEIKSGTRTGVLEVFVNTAAGMLCKATNGAGNQVNGGKGPFINEFSGVTTLDVTATTGNFTFNPTS